MNQIFLAGALAIATIFSVVASAAEPVAAPAYSTADSNVGELLDNPKTKAIVDKYLPGFSAAPQIDMARGMSLKSVQTFAPDSVTDDALAQIDAELAKLPAGK